MPVLSGSPLVTLRHASARPYDAAIAAARTCYSPRVIGSEEVTPQQRETIGPLTFEGGHHTVFQHAHFEFGLENVSRQFVWSFLHSHPFYNSEQSSQRFVRLDEVRALVPEALAGEARVVYEAAVEAAWDSYRRLTALLQGRHAADPDRAAAPDAQRLGQAAQEGRARGGEEGDRDGALRDPDRRLHLDGAHGLGHRAAPPAPDDADGRRAVRDARGDRGDGRAGEGDRPGLLRSHRPRAARRAARWSRRDCRCFTADGDAEAARLDALLGTRVSLLVDHMPRAEQTTAEAVRAVLGASPEALSDDEALERLLNPGLNRYRLETLQLSVHSPLTRAMHHASYTFLKKLSHTADSQDQRHRMVPASRPLMTLTDTRRPDCITPPLVAANAEALAVYQEAMDRAWAAKNRLLELGVPLETALYVLPNAKALRFHESGSLLYLAHKWVMRTCFNAQEEIYRASMDELEQLRAIHPRLARHMGPPCVLRHSRITPTCTEGEHFCGVPVWRSFPDVERPL